MSRDKQQKSREAWKRRRAQRQRSGEEGRPTTTPAGVPGEIALSMPPMRMIERKLHELSGQGAPQTPPEEAQDLVWQAFETNGVERRCQLAQQALALCPDCADAYTLLAENAGSRAEALDLYTRAVAAAERTLGPLAFQEHVGRFWGVLETRPYMRARAGLAGALWATGRRDDAVGHLQDMLRLNPNDNQGLRYELATCLLKLDRHADLRTLFDQYPDEAAATFAYCRALLAFRSEGDSATARQLLEGAIAKNTHVPAYLLELKSISEIPQHYSLGQESEAIFLSRSLMGVWKATPGATNWLRAQLHQGQGSAVPVAPTSAVSRTSEVKPRSVLPAAEKKKLLAIPRRQLTWQVALRHTPNIVEDAGRSVRGRIVLVMETKSGLMLAGDLIDSVLTPDLLWKCLTECMTSATPGVSVHRPVRVQVCPDALWEPLRSRLDEVGIELDVVDALDELDFAWEDLRRSFLKDPEEKGLLEVPGVDAPCVGAVFAAAADFWRAAPWTQLSYESVMEVVCDRIPGGPKYAVIMGQAGNTFGLSLYDDLKPLQEMMTGRFSDLECIRRTIATTVVYGSEGEIPLADLEAALRHGWPIADRDAYPWIFRKEGSTRPRPPVRRQLELLDVALRAVPAFVSRRDQMDTTREEVSVKTAAGDVRVGLRWIED